MIRPILRPLGLVAVAFISTSQSLVALQASQGSPPAVAADRAVPDARGKAVLPPADYVIGPEDILMIVFWREPDVSGEVVVRPDGMISLPLLQDVHAAGLTPEQLAARLAQDASRFLEVPVATVTVRQINSRKVFITGEVQKPGTYQIAAPMTVLQLIAMAGGLNEYADAENITVVRVVKGRPVGYRFNYRVVSQRKAMDQNIFLQPGDTIIVP